MNKNKTNRAGSALGLGPYSWQNGKNRKRPVGVGASTGEWNLEIIHNPYYTR